MIFLTGHGDVPTAVAAVKRGAFDFVEKPFADNALVDRVEQALQASAAGAAAARRARRWSRARLAELTERERDVMQLVIDGRPNKLIADAAGHQRAHGRGPPRAGVREDGRQVGGRAGQPACAST